MTQTEHSTGGINDDSAAADRQAVSIASVLNQVGRVGGQLQAALSRSATIDQAIGVLISRGGGSAEEAMAALRDVGRAHGCDPGTVARQIVQEVSRESHARHVQR